MHQQRRKGKKKSIQKIQWNGAEMLTTSLMFVVNDQFGERIKRVTVIDAEFPRVTLLYMVVFYNAVAGRTTASQYSERFITMEITISYCALTLLVEHLAQQVSE